MEASGYCSNCGRAIGNLEQAFTWRNARVCRDCYVKLQGIQSPQAVDPLTPARAGATPSNPTPYPPPGPTLGYGQPPPPTANPLGTAGFIVSLLGLFLGFVPCVVGLILSLIALKRQPKGLAIAGTIIGLVGTLAPLILLAIFGFAIFTVCLTCIGMGNAMAPNVQTQTAIQNARNDIETYEIEHAGKLPPDADGNTAIAKEHDGWGHALKYTPLPGDCFEIRSPGPDGIFGNGDDRHATFENQGLTQPLRTQPAPTQPMPLQPERP